MLKNDGNSRNYKAVHQDGRYETDGIIKKNSIYEPVYTSLQTETYVFSSDEKERNIITFSELLHLWQKANEIRLKGGTKKRYDNLIHSHIIPELGQLKLSELTAQIINIFLNNKMLHGRLDGDGGLSANYVRSISMIITSSLNYAADEGFCAPLKGKINKPSLTKTEHTVLTKENQTILEKYIINNPTSTNIGIMISLYSGLRIGEICALHWNDIDLNVGTIYVRHTVSRINSENGIRKTALILDEPKTASSKRVVPISSPLLSVLRDYRKTDTTTYVVSNTNSFISPRTYEVRFHKILKECNIPDINYHVLRHTFATRCIEVGVDVKSLSEILGHSNVSVTLNTYVHSSLEMKKQQLEKLTRLYSPI